MTFDDYCRENNKLELLKEWDYEKNAPLTPELITTSSSIPMSWKCSSCGHAFKVSVADRLLGMNCPKCNKVKIIRKDRIPRKNYIGKRFGELEVIEYVGVSKESIWKCKCCYCGKEILAKQSRLFKGSTISCECVRVKKRKESFKNSIHFVDGTCIEKIAAKITPKNNTSGFRGVYKRGNKWRVSMNFKGRRYNLGTYAKFEDAKEARIAGEKMIDDFLEEYQNRFQ